MARREIAGSIVRGESSRRGSGAIKLIMRADLGTRGRDAWVERSRG